MSHESNDGALAQGRIIINTSNNSYLITGPNNEQFNMLPWDTRRDDIGPGSCFILLDTLDAVPENATPNPDKLRTFRKSLQDRLGRRQARAASAAEVVGTPLTNVYAPDRHGVLAPLTTQRVNTPKLTLAMLADRFPSALQPAAREKLANAPAVPPRKGESVVSKTVQEDDEEEGETAPAATTLPRAPVTEEDANPVVVPSSNRPRPAQQSTKKSR